MAASLHPHLAMVPSSASGTGEVAQRSLSFQAPSVPRRDDSPVLPRLLAVFHRTWDLGLTAFGGPPVHFTILHRRFVQVSSLTAASDEGNKTTIGADAWLDEQTFQELFAVAQSLPGPASTKMLFSIALIHAGVPAAFLAFALWSLPGAIVMYGLSLGVSQMGEVLPSPVYALLSGLNASTVGVVALAAVQLAEKAVKDRMTRILVIWGGCAGLCYNALWYFPVLIVAGGIACAAWDIWLQRAVQRLKIRWSRRKEQQGRVEEATGPTTTGRTHDGGIEMAQLPAIHSQDTLQRRPKGDKGDTRISSAAESSRAALGTQSERHTPAAATSLPIDAPRFYGITISTGIGLIALTFGMHPPHAFSVHLLPIC